MSGVPNDGPGGVRPARQARVEELAGHLAPALELDPPTTSHFFRLPRWNEPREDGALGMAPRDPHDVGQDALHPRRAPGRTRREQALHVDAHMR